MIKLTFSIFMNVFLPPMIKISSQIIASFDLHDNSAKMLRDVSVTYTHFVCEQIIDIKTR